MAPMGEFWDTLKDGLGHMFSIVSVDYFLTIVQNILFDFGEFFQKIVKWLP